MALGGNLLLPQFGSALPDSATEPNDPSWSREQRLPCTHTYACARKHRHSRMHSGHDSCLCTPRHPQAQMHVLTHTHVCPQMPLNPSPEIWLLPVPTSGLPARLAAPCQLPWQCCCCQEMKFALPRCGEGSRAARGPSCPSHCRACPSAWGAVPTQPRSWTLSSRLQLPHKPQTCCLQDQGKLSRRVL